MNDSIKFAKWLKKEYDHLCFNDDELEGLYIEYLVETYNYEEVSNMYDKGIITYEQFSKHWEGLTN